MSLLKSLMKQLVLKSKTNQRLKARNKQSVSPTLSENSVPVTGETRTSSASSRASDATTVVTESADPYVDFRRSMQEMVDANHVDEFGILDWDFLEELLAHFLELNDTEVHECIFRAFMDLTESLMISAARRNSV